MEVDGILLLLLVMKEILLGINWRKNNYKESLCNLVMSDKLIEFSVDKNQAVVINSFKERFASLNDTDFYYAAVSFVTPPKNLLHKLKYNND